MKALFLDVDGVLNNQVYNAEFAKDGGDVLFALDPKCMERLKHVVEQTGCRVVLSSAWRLFTDSRALLDEALAELGIVIQSVTPYAGREGDVIIHESRREMQDRSATRQRRRRLAQPGTVRRRPRWTPRRDEIRAWLVDSTDRVERYAILDDDAGADTDEGCFFRTDYRDGLTAAIAGRLVEHLGRRP